VYLPERLDLPVSRDVPRDRGPAFGLNLLIQEAAPGAAYVVKDGLKVTI